MVAEDHRLITIMCSGSSSPAKPFTCIANESSAAQFGTCSVCGETVKIVYQRGTWIAEWHRS